MLRQIIFFYFWEVVFIKEISLLLLDEQLFESLIKKN